MTPNQKNHVDAAFAQADALEAVLGMPMPASALLRALAQDVSALDDQVSALESLRPVWATGHSSDSVAAQDTAAALAQLWKFLGVKNQTQAVSRLKALLGED